MYCPQCLAGDGSPIQDQHGGAWRKTWRLPIVFACAVHRRLLEHLCPSCGQPAMSAASLIPCSRVGGLHPVQCRTALSTPRGGRPVLCIDPAIWQDIISQLPRTKGPFQPELSDCKRQFASEAVWARVTQGEHVLAPRIIENQAASGDPTRHRRRGNMWHFYLASPPRPHYAALKDILNAYADNLAAAIDRTAVATATRRLGRPGRLCTIADDQGTRDAHRTVGNAIDHGDK